MKSDHYCKDCDELVHVGVDPSQQEMTSENWRWYPCPLCDGINIFPIGMVRQSILDKCERKIKLKYLLDENR